MIRRPPRSTLFPTRRSSDLREELEEGQSLREVPLCAGRPVRRSEPRDRKSTRLNSSHGYISYAVFCLKKKKTHPQAGSIYRPDHAVRTRPCSRCAFTSFTEF